MVDLSPKSVLFLVRGQNCDRRIERSDDPKVIVASIHSPQKDRSISTPTASRRASGQLTTLI